VHGDEGWRDWAVDKSPCHYTVEELSISFLLIVKGLFSNMGSIVDGQMPKLKPPKMSVQEQNAFAEAPAA
jgi:hypothetical protein